MAYIITRRTALAALAGSLAVLRAPEAMAADKLRVGKAVAENFGNVPLDVGMQFGIFEKLGLEIDEINFAGGAKMAQAVVAGAVDISLSSGPEMALIAKGLPEIAIGTIADSAAFMGISVGNGFTGHGIDSLKGKTIGITTAGSLTEWIVLELNLVKGWTGTDRAIPLAIGGSPTAAFAALKVGQIDADVGGTSTGYQLEEHNAGRLLINCSEFVNSIELFTIFASTALIKQNPDAVRRFLKGWYESIAFMKSHKAETVPLAAKVMGYTPAVAERMYDTLMAKFSTDGKFNPQALDTLRASFIDLKVINSPSIDMSKFYTTEFLPEDMSGGMSRPVIPAANLDTKPFWDGCAEGKLLLQRCAVCDAYRHPPSPICPHCLSDAHAWVPASGHGMLYTFVVVRETRDRRWDKMIPYVLAVVELAEGPRILTNLTNVAPEDVAIGMPVAVIFAELDGTTRLPLFQPR